MNPYRRQRLASTAEAFCKFFHDPSKPGFKGSTNLENLSDEESSYFKQVVETLLQKPVKPTEWLTNCLEDKSLDHLALFLIGSDTLSPDLKIAVNGNTAFTLTVKHGLNLSDKKDFMHLLQILYKRGYQSQQADLQYLKTSYDQLKNEYQCLVWSLARFAYKLNDTALIEKAFQFHMPLLTIASFKMGRPFGINYHNLLGIANNALQHYRSHIELIIHAMETYDVFYDIEKRDHKNTFKQRMEDYYDTMPPQDSDIAEVAFLLFPELSETNNTTLS
jgi:hypothetical protein